MRDAQVLEATQGQMNGFLSQLPYKCYQDQVASVRNGLKICHWVVCRVDLAGEQGAGCARRTGPGAPRTGRQPRGKCMISLINSHKNVTLKRWHLLEIDLRFALNSTPGWGGRDTWWESRELVVRDAQVLEHRAPADLRRDRHQHVVVQEQRLQPRRDSTLSFGHWLSDEHSAAATLFKRTTVSASDRLRGRNSEAS